MKQEKPPAIPCHGYTPAHLWPRTASNRTGFTQRPDDNYVGAELRGITLFLSSIAQIVGKDYGITPLTQEWLDRAEAIKRQNSDHKGRGHKVEEHDQQRQRDNLERTTGKTVEQILSEIASPAAPKRAGVKAWIKARADVKRMITRLTAAKRELRASPAYTREVRFTLSVNDEFHPIIIDHENDAAAG